MDITLNTILVAAVIFVFTYALISLRKFRGRKINMGLAAAVGGILMVVFGIVAINDIPDLINFDVILLLLGMMMLAASLEFSKFFCLVSDLLIKFSGSKVKLLACIMIICAVLSAMILNDAVVLIFTPIVIKCCRSTGCNPIPYLIGVMFSANIGSLATPIGNPQNAYIASEAGISFIDFTLHTLPISLLCLPIAFLMIYLIFRKNLTSDMPCIDRNEDVEIDRTRLWAAVIVMLGAFVGFIISGIVGIPIWIIAMTAGVLALAVVMSSSFQNVTWIAKKIDWSILIFFAGLFILMGGISASGMLDEMTSFFPGFGSGETMSILNLTAFTAILSNLVSNVPAVVLISDLLSTDNMTLLMTLAASSTLAGNATLIGSAANVIVSERSENDGISFNFWKFALIGVPVTLVTLLISIGILTLIG